MGQTVDSGPAGAPAHLVGPYLAGVLDEEAWAQCTVALIPGGRSNLTYVVSSAAGSVILRRPPLGHVLPTAHDMGREYRVMGALAGTSVPVPRMLHRCEDRSVLGASFYVMERVEGHILRSENWLTATFPATRAGQRTLRPARR